MNIERWTSAIARKGRAGLNRIPRVAARLCASPQDYTLRPPVLVNSLPKSGTHLLMQVAAALPATRYYGSFIAERPSISLRSSGQVSIDARLDRIVPGEIVGSHLHFSEATAAKIRQINALHLFIYRDPRAVVVSEAHYLAHMAPWNSLSKRFATAGSESAQIDLAIHGDGTPELPAIGERYGPYLAWRHAPDTVSIAFEALMDPERRGAILESIAQRYVALNADAGLDVDPERLTVNIAPELSHTFSGSDPDRWRRVLTKDQKDAIIAQFPEFGDKPGEGAAK